MLKFNILRKTTSSCIIFLLLSTLFFSINGISEPVENLQDGYIYDDFKDYNNINHAKTNGTIDKVTNCIIDNGEIVLGYGCGTQNFDCSINPDKIQAWKIKNTVLNIPILTTPDFLLKRGEDVEEFTNEEYSKISVIDDIYATTVAKSLRYIGTTYSAINHFRIETDFERDKVESILINWKSSDYFEEANLDTITMYIWKYENKWKQWYPGDQIVYEEEIVNNKMFHLSYSTNEISISDQGYIDILIVGTPKNFSNFSYLNTDFFNATVTLKEGRFSNGEIISKPLPISSTPVYGWEALFWEYSKTSDTDIKVQILDESQEDIEKDGKEVFFTESPIDLSWIGGNRRIRIKVIFESNSIDSTPSLESWSVLWQSSENGFSDRFTSEYRLSEKNGVETKNGLISISKFLSDWAVRGKNPENTRGYKSIDKSEFDEELYWFSNKDIDIGGGFREPVVFDGRVYVPGADKKIYCFNETAFYSGFYINPQPILDSSYPFYNVYSSLAVNDKAIIAATCDPNTKENKIYALNRSNLKEELWNYSINDYVCFMGAPTIEDDVVYISSWHGRFSNIPVISMIFDNIDEIISRFGFSFGRNNYLFALNINNGELMWDDPITLPEASYSTPAVYDDHIFVGCENLKGKSLIAYDKNSGEELWNKSIGLTGRCNPVVYDNKIFILTRVQQKDFNFSGADMIYAFDIEGNELWNYTINPNSTIKITNVIKPALNFDNKIITSSPISSMAVHNDRIVFITPDGTLYCFSTEGDLKWMKDTNSESGINIDIIPSYNSASPIIVEDTVYIATEYGSIMTFSLSSGVIKQNYQILSPDYDYEVPIFIYASPVVVDNLIFVSIVENILPANKDYRIYCIGDYEANKVGQVISLPIHVQKGKWWNEFFAEINPTDPATGNKITFEILDEDKNVISGFSNLNGSSVDISGISDNVIYLKATIQKNNETEPLAIDSWQVTWLPENDAPMFIDDSFKPGEEGWVRSNLEECSIEVRDVGVGDILSGLDVDTAEFTLNYIKEGSNSITSTTRDAICEPNTQGVEQSILTADLSSINAKTLINISFMISDRAGNLRQSNITSFRIDDLEPSSEIIDLNNFSDSYNSFFEIESISEDFGNGEFGPSGVNDVYLKYRYSTDNENWGEWMNYGDPVGDWYFGIENISSQEPMDSGYYQILTIADDKAENIEEIDNDKISDALNILFDANKPSFSDLSGTYKNISIPSFELIADDDFKLSSIEYRMDYETEWTVIKDDINDVSYSEIWSIPEDIWANLNDEQLHYIYFRIKDIADNELITDPENSPSVIKDENASKILLDVTEFKELQLDDSFIIKLNIPDEIDISEVRLLYKYSESDDNWNDSEWIQFGDNITGSPYKWDFIANKGNGYYQFQTVIIDNQGHVYTSQLEKVQVNVVPQSQFLLVIILLIALIVISIFVVIYMKKPKVN